MVRNVDSIPANLQALALLFQRSGWTQDELAKKEGKGQQWVSRHLLFGRFLSFTPTGVSIESLPANLTERRFRAFWSCAQCARRPQRLDPGRAGREGRQGSLLYRPPSAVRALSAIYYHGSKT
jgi:hypothetical protein